jgi:hypothetical protein
MKITVRTSAGIRVYPADAVLPADVRTSVPTGVDPRGPIEARTRVDTRRAATGADFLRFRV